MALTVTLKVASLTDDRARRKAMEAVADILGVDSIAVDMKDRKLTVVGGVDTLVVVKKLKRFGKVEVMSVGTDKVEKKEEKKVQETWGEEKKGDQKKDEKK